MVVNYYSNLITFLEPDDIEEVVQCTELVVTEEINKNLIGTFSRVEVWVALK